MRSLLPIGVSLWLLALQAAHAQTADDFFNGGAQSYISNNIPKALESVDTGLKQYPDDVKLKKLYELLKQQSQQQQNQQNQQNQSNQQESKNNQAQQNSQPHQQQNQQAQKQQPAQAPSSQPKGESLGKENGEQTANTVETMTPQEAKQLLDAQKGDEQVLQLKRKGSPQNSGRPFKDW